MRKRLDNNTILSITATIVSICALFVAAYQTILMRQQQSAAVWPKLVISNPYVTGTGIVPYYKLIVRNVGVGPAIIRDVKLTCNNKQFGDMDEYARFVLKRHNALDSLSYDYNDLLPEAVVPQGEQVVLFDTYKNAAAVHFIRNVKDFRVAVTYESIYGEQWQVQYPKRKTK